MGVWMAIWLFVIGFSGIVGKWSVCDSVQLTRMVPLLCNAVLQGKEFLSFASCVWNESLNRTAVGYCAFHFCWELLGCTTVGNDVCETNPRYSGFDWLELLLKRCFNVVIVKLHRIWPQFSKSCGLGIVIFVVVFLLFSGWHWGRNFCSFSFVHLKFGSFCFYQLIYYAEGCFETWKVRHCILWSSVLLFNGINDIFFGLTAALVVWFNEALAVVINLEIENCGHYSIDEWVRSRWLSLD